MKQRTKSRRTAAAVLICVVLAAGAATAAVGDHLWSKGYGVGSDHAVAVDGSGHAVVHGTFFGTVDFGGGPLSATNFFDGDQFLARFDADGNHLWSLKFSPSGFGVGNEKAAVDPAGNIYLSGRTYNGTTLDFGGGPLPGDSGYLAKFDADGVFQWSLACGDATITDLAADGAHLVVTGYTTTGADFGGGVVGTAGGYDIFVASFTAAGSHAWSAGFGNPSDQGGMSVAIDGSGNVIVAGSQFGTIDFGGGALAANGLDLFLASFDATGVHNWSKLFDGVFTPGAGILIDTTVATGPAGAVALVGEIIGTADFGGGPLASNGYADAFCAVFAVDGTPTWSISYGSSPQSEHAQGAAFDGSGNLMVAGTFGEATDFGGGTIPLNGSPANGNRNLYVALYDPAGAHVFSQGYGEYVYGADCAVFGNGDLLVFGGGGPGLDLGGGVLAQAELFIGKLAGGGGGGSSAVGDLPSTAGFALRGHPNPFNPRTTIAYTVAAQGEVGLAAYDVRGRLVADLVPLRSHAAGTYEVPFTPGVSGVYLVRMQAGGREQVLKLVAVK